MNKNDHIQYWITTSNDDWGVVEVLFEKNKFVQALFFGHLLIEKLCKAHWVKCNESNVPPKTHNLLYIISQTDLKLSDEQLKYFNRLNDYQIEGRYPEHKNLLHKFTTKEIAQPLLNQIIELRKCLLENLQ